MHELAHQRCFHHARREAVARCPECGKFYCRECVTEHEDRVVCASCLTQLTAGGKERKARLAALGRVGLCAVSFLILWFFFYVLGRGLLALPSTFHEGTVWKTDYWESR